MAPCPHCNSTVSRRPLVALEEKCPECGRTTGDRDSVQWVDVVRVANLAEAGFLSDELIGMGIEARVYQSDEFSAASDRWSSKFLVRVPAESAEDAADHVRQYLFDDDDAGKSTLDAFRFSLVGRSGQPLSWRPVAVMVLAGVASFVLVQRFSDQNGPRALSQDSLLSALHGIGRPFTTEREANQPQYRLSFDGRHQSWMLEVDRQDDGIFETSQRFLATGAVH